MNNRLPEGYLKDSKGRLVPIELVEPIDQQRDELVLRFVRQAKALQATMKTFKELCMSEVQSFIELSAHEYNIELGGAQGNVTLTSYDGQYKIQRAIAERITFDERLLVAKELIDNCIKRWTEGSRSEIRVLVQDAFQTDKTGNINTARVLSLRKFSINDPEWKQAMQAITDSITVVGSKSYMRLYKRIGNSEQWEQISLDMASI